VTFPDQTRITCLGIFLRGVDEWRVPAPAIGAGQPHAALEQIHGGLVTHAATGVDVVGLAEFGARAGVDDDDLQRRQRVADALELLFDVVGGHDVTIRQVSGVELHAGLKAPFQRHLVDRP